MSFSLGGFSLFCFFIRFPFSSRGATRADDSDCVFSLRVRYHEQLHAMRHANINEAMLRMGMVRIRDGYREAVPKNGGCLIEGDSVFLQIALRFVGIPLEFNRRSDFTTVTLTDFLEISAAFKRPRCPADGLPPSRFRLSAGSCNGVLGRHSSRLYGSNQREGSINSMRLPNGSAIYT